MNTDWYPGIKEFCAHWSHAPTLQQTLDALEREFAEENDGCIDAAKAIVEVSCRLIISNLDDPLNPYKFQKKDPDFGEWITAAVRLLGLSENRDHAFKKLISRHHDLTTTLGDLRNRAGTLSHGKDGFIEKLSMHHRRSALLAADAIVTFLHTAYLEREWDPTRTLEPYERFRPANAIIDRFATITSRTDDDGVLHTTVLLPDGDEIPLIIEPSRLLFGIDREAYKLALDAFRGAQATAALRSTVQDDNT